MRIIVALNILAVAAMATDNSVLIADLTLKLEKGLRRPGENLLISGSSIQTAMAMVYLGAKGTTETQISEALRFKELENIHQTEKKMLESYKDRKNDNTVDVANRIFVQNNFDILPSYKYNVSKYYGPGYEEVNFKDSAATSKKINDWVSKETGHKINGLVDPNSIDGGTKMILENVIYFRGFWATPFNRSLTSDGEFYVEDGTEVTTQFINLYDQEMNYTYLTQLDASVIVLPYTRNCIKMFILLPGYMSFQTETNLTSILHQLDAETLLNITSQTVPRKFTSIAFPKFKLETTYSTDLMAALQNLGIKDIFDEHLSDLSGISTIPHLYVNAIQHNAAIEVDEEGTKASAVNKVTTSVRSITIFEVKRPFAFWLLDTSADTILFFGIYNKPPN